MITNAVNSEPIDTDHVEAIALSLGVGIEALHMAHSECLPPALYGGRTALEALSTSAVGWINDDPDLQAQIDALIGMTEEDTDGEVCQNCGQVHDGSDGYETLALAVAAMSEIVVEAYHEEGEDSIFLLLASMMRLHSTLNHAMGAVTEVLRRVNPDMEAQEFWDKLGEQMQEWEIRVQTKTGLAHIMMETGVGMPEAPPTRND